MRAGLRGERGSALAALAVALAIAVCGIAAVGAGTALAARQRVLVAADAAALAAADALSGAVVAEPCDAANRVAAANGAALDACSADGAVATVETAASVLGVRVTATARAGPPPEPGALLPCGPPAPRRRLTVGSSRPRGNPGR